MLTLILHMIDFVPFVSLLVSVLLLYLLFLFLLLFLVVVRLFELCRNPLTVLLLSVGILFLLLKKSRFMIFL